MKLRKSVLLPLAGALVFAMSVSAASFAAEGKITEEKPAEEETIAEEAADAGEEASGLEGVLGTIREQLVQAEEKVSETLSGDTAAAVSEELGEAKEALGGFLDSLFEEGGQLTEILPDGVDLETAVSALKDRLGQIDSSIAEGVGALLEKAQSGEGGFNLDAVKEYARELLGQFFQGMDFSGTDWEEMFRVYDCMREEQQAYMVEKNAEQMDCGEVQIFSNSWIYENDLEEDFMTTEEIRTLASLIQNNYTMDEENQLRWVSESEDVVLFVQQRDENGNYPVKDARFAQTGEDYQPSVEAFCGELGEPVAECMDSIELNRVMVTYNLYDYLEQHPDIKGIEYEGEIRTARELYEIWDAMLEKYGESEETDGESEPSEEDAVSDAAGTGMTLEATEEEEKAEEPKA